MKSLPRSRYAPQGRGKKKKDVVGVGGVQEEGKAAFENFVR